MSVLFEGVGGREVELQRLLLQDFCDATIVGLQLQLELVQLQVKLSQVTIHKSIALLGV